MIMRAMAATLLTISLMGCPHEFPRLGPGGMDQTVADHGEGEAHKGDALLDKDGEQDGNLCGKSACNAPPGPCYKAPGTCLDGGCFYMPLPSGTACDPGDKCILYAVCDGKGGCAGKALDCSLPHATGGTCVGGACTGFTCDSGWGNCNGAWSDGCETRLDTLSDCGGCGIACSAALNATPKCSNGKCALTCTAPWQDCDGLYSNGCEIPVGEANRCNRMGLAPFSGPTPPCGTPYCGKSSSADAQNFGSWYCLFCSHCTKTPGKTGYSWCLYHAPAAGNFSAETCPSCCSASLPQVCK